MAGVAGLKLSGEGMGEKLILCFILIRLQGCIKNRLEVGIIHWGDTRHCSYVVRGNKKLVCVGGREKGNNYNSLELCDPI